MPYVCDSLESKQTVIVDSYNNKLLRLNDAGSKKGSVKERGMRPIKILHDSARPYVAQSVKKT